MHIVLLNDDALSTARGGAKGGAVVIVENLRRGFAKAGHRVTFITTHRSEEKKSLLRSRDESGETISIGVSYPYEQRHRRCLHIPHVAEHLKKLFEELRPDVVNAHNIHTYLTYESLSIARDVTSKIFLTAHDTYLVSFERVRSKAYEEAALHEKEWRMHWWNHLSAAGRKYWPFRNPAICSILKKSGTQIIGISDATKRFLEKNGLPVFAVIPNGIALPLMPNKEDVDAFRKRHRLCGPTVLFAGRVREDKGIGALLRAGGHLLQKHPDLQILVAGDLQRMQRFLKECPEHVRKAVVVTDWIEQKEMPLVYRSSDIVAVPSLYLDNFPTVNLEALAYERPVVGTPFGGTPEVIIDGQTGFIRNPHESDAFADALDALLRDSSLRERMGKEGRKRISERFSLEKQITEYLRLFEGMKK